MRENLIRAYNELLDISIKGSDSVRMANALTLLEQAINSIPQEPAPVPVPVASEESEKKTK